LDIFKEAKFYNNKIVVHAEKDNEHGLGVDSASCSSDNLLDSANDNDMNSPLNKKVTYDNLASRWVDINDNDSVKSLREICMLLFFHFVVICSKDK
jgi:hypothetical protein